MNKVNVRDLRNHGGEVLDLVSAGQEIVVERAGTPVAKLVPLAQRRLDADALIERRRSLPVVDVERFRRDLDDAIDSAL